MYVDWGFYVFSTLSVRGSWAFLFSAGGSEFSSSSSIMQSARMPNLFLVVMFCMLVSIPCIIVVGRESENEEILLRRAIVLDRFSGALFLGTGHVSVGVSSFLLPSRAVLRVGLSNFSDRRLGSRTS